MIYITGDIHGNPVRLSTRCFPEQREMTKNDYVIILGDFGLIWDYKGENNTEHYWLNWLEEKHFTTLFVDGNHENFNRLNSYDVVEWNGGKVHKIRDSVIHLMRGQYFNIDGTTIFTFGGAQSHDISDGILSPFDSDFKYKKRVLDCSSSLYRIDQINWWKQELPSQEELDEGIKNLEAHNYKVDYILTHSPYSSALKYMIHQDSEIDILSEYLEEVKNKTTYKKFYFGHMHVNLSIPWDNAMCLYSGRMRIA